MGLSMGRKESTLKVSLMFVIGAGIMPKYSHHDSELLLALGLNDEYMGHIQPVRHPKGNNL